MSKPIEDYALIGDCHGAGLVAKDGSIDWLCIPRFDSGACFAALLGDDSHGRFSIAPCEEVLETKRRYRDGTLILETDLRTESGIVRLVDSMPIESQQNDVVRLVQGLKGEVEMDLDLVIRFDTGKLIPWVTTRDDELQATAGPDKLHLRTSVELSGEDHRTTGRFVVKEGEEVPFVLSYHPSHLPNCEKIDASQAVLDTETWWREWSQRTMPAGDYTSIIKRSLIVLKALTYMPTGGVVAAPTTSLPEAIGGHRNWDYRFCWLRDATITLSSLFRAGFEKEAGDFREWLLRAVAGDPSQVQIMYDIEGRRELHEFTASWLTGYEGSRPVRVGNGAHAQLQLDVYGELMNTMHQCRTRGMENADSWSLERALVRHLENQWQKPDQGIWEMRGQPRHFVHSKVMCWLAFDRAVEAVRRFGREGPADHWAAIRDRIHAEVCEQGYDSSLGAFTQSYGSKRMDASLLMMALVGFLPPSDPRVRGTVRAIQEHLSDSPGLIKRYQEGTNVDGIKSGEGCFLPCCFWLAENLHLMGETEEAREMFDVLLGVCNDVGLYSEEYQCETQRLVGNFPQALTHLSLVDCAYTLMLGAEESRGERASPAHSR